ncbi:MAG: hypothetical protein Q9178_007071 [Gyalolechia marmorata]
MAEPLSFVASIIAVATLSGHVATKGHRYLKAVKDCPDEVRTLLAEVNVLCAILDRLSILLRRRKSLSNATGAAESGAINDAFEDATIDDTETDASSESEDEATRLETPVFIYDCQRNLEEIQSILHKFGRPGTQSQQKPRRVSRFSISALRRLESKDLTWPLSKSKTLQLLQTLERHKTTCIIALAEGGTSNIHNVLMESKLSNRYLADIGAKQDKILELQLSQEEGQSSFAGLSSVDLFPALLFRCSQPVRLSSFIPLIVDLEKFLAWLSPVNAAIKHQAFREERHPGTGAWLFDLPEIAHWLDNPNDALWIYGIPGAGKTMLSTLVVDEILTRKRSNTVGTAYFYVRHDDKLSQNPINVLGSIISQLARQNSEAYAHLVSTHTQAYTQGLSLPNKQELSETLHHMIPSFREIYIMIDGLDESGSCFDLNRSHLIDLVAGLPEEGSIRTLIFSRDEQDIRIQLIQKQFHTVSIAATSADLRLFANAWLGRLEIQSEKLRMNIVDTLVDEANGMFMWVRAQVDYLQRLPNDLEKRKALTKLPPDLPQTYIRIFETMSSTYPLQTIQFIKRLLKWLVFGPPGELIPCPYSTTHDYQSGLSPDELCLAICIENERDWPTNDVVPTPDQVLRWLGCLVRYDQETATIQLSHFTIHEFLSIDPQTVSSLIARRFLVGLEDKGYVVNICLTYLLHSHFEDTVCTTESQAEAFFSQHPFYEYIHYTLFDHLFYDNGYNAESDRLARRFLCMPPSSAFQLWQSCSLGHEYEARMQSPLHFAAAVCLESRVEGLLREGADPDSNGMLEGSCITPLHLAICVGIVGEFWIEKKNLFVVRNKDATRIAKVEERQASTLQMTGMLVEYGADVNRQLPIHLHLEETDLIVTPLTLALLCHNWTAASRLLSAGAAWDATPHFNLEGTIEACSIRKLLSRYPDCEDIVQQAIGSSGHGALAATLTEWRSLPDEVGSHSCSDSSSDDSNGVPQDAFIAAFSNKDWQEVQRLLSMDLYLDIDRADKNGWNAIHYAAEFSRDALKLLLEHGASVDPLTVCVASTNGHVENIKLLLEYGVDINHRDFQGVTPLLCSVNGGQTEALQVLFGAGANINARLDDGRGALHLAIRNRNITLLSALLQTEADLFRPDNYGTTPLHLACYYGLEDLVKQLIEAMDTPSEEVNVNSLHFGTPLYTAAWVGSVSLINTLLDYGAEISQTSSGNILGTALLAACAEGHSEAVKTLLSRGATLEIDGARFKSAEGTARAFRKEGILQVLEEYKKTCEEEEKKDEPLDGNDTEHAHDIENPNNPYPETSNERDNRTLGAEYENGTLETELAVHGSESRVESMTREFARVEISSLLN